MLPSDEQKIWEQRTKDYKSDGISNLKNVGLLWTGILQEYYKIEFPSPVPSHIVATMMAAVKVSRIAGGAYKEDNYIDGIVYLRIAMKGQPK